MILNKLQIGLVSLAAFLLGVFVTTVVMSPTKPIKYYTYVCQDGLSYANITKYQFINNVIKFTSINWTNHEVSAEAIITPGCIIIEQGRKFTSAKEASKDVFSKINTK